MPLTGFSGRVLPDLRVDAGQGGSAEYGIAELFGDHDGGSIGVAVGHRRHDRCIHDAKSADSMDPALCVHNSPEIVACAHARGSGQVPLRGRVRSQMRVEILITLGVRTWKDFGSAKIRERGLVHQVPHQSNSAAHQFPVTVVLQVVQQDPGRAGRVGIAQGNGTPAVGPHEAQMDLERMFRKRLPTAAVDRNR